MKKVIFALMLVFAIPTVTLASGSGEVANIAQYEVGPGGRSSVNYNRKLIKKKMFKGFGKIKLPKGVGTRKVLFIKIKN